MFKHNSPIRTEAKGGQLGVNNILVLCFTYTPNGELYFSDIYLNLVGWIAFASVIKISPQVAKRGKSRAIQNCSSEEKE